jgi:ubiquinone biosynthesis protein COQ9
MRQKEAMIPTPMLDSMWRYSKSKRDEFLQLARECGVLSPFVRANLVNYADKKSEKFQTTRRFIDKKPVDF